MNGRHHILLRPILSEQLWNDFKSRMHGNQFILITLDGGSKSQLILYYCHRRVMNVLPGQYILIFGPVSICFHDFTDVNGETVYELERMRHLRLNGRVFRFRVQSNSHKLFINPNDIIDGRIDFQWIQQLPPVLADQNQQQQQQQNSDAVIHEDSL
ncbi:hypothetical protein BLA29_010994 [Euroglyphus maynei]|uniref:Uncharacterized protein n=1 Tax=Euroglyphus maynei TaxID=6958 RepID=A0A1Y3BJ54_EURMA|nr:hypothetical protein BLA29_010994 [Euroglyphus maynei]